MKKVNVYDDGKIRRGEPATLIKYGNKRVLITFYDWDGNLITEWFYRDSRKRKGVYSHVDTNSWFYEYRETEEFKQEVKDYSLERYNSLFGEQKCPLST